MSNSLEELEADRDLVTPSENDQVVVEETVLEVVPVRCSSVSDIVSVADLVTVTVSLAVEVRPANVSLAVAVTVLSPVTVQVADI